MNLFKAIKTEDPDKFQKVTGHKEKDKDMKSSQQNIEDFIYQKESKENVSHLFPFQDSAPPSPAQGRETPLDIPPSFLFPILLELIDRTRGSLAAMKTLAFYSRENFRDAELGDYFYRVVSEDIEKTISLLDCFCDYININTPVKKADTVHTLLEEVLRENRDELQEKGIKIIRKKFDPELPETTLTDEQLRFVFNSIVQYILSSISFNGRIGILTRSIEAQEWKGEGKEGLQSNQKYIEIFIVLTHLDPKGQPEASFPSHPKESQEQKADLILQMVKKTLEKNRGAMEAKWEARKGMTLISLILPIERRNVFQFISAQDRIKKIVRKD